MLAFLFIATTVAVPDRPNPTPEDSRALPQQLLGRWIILRRINNGIDDLNLAGLHMVFSPDSMQHFTENGTRAGGIFPYRLDTTSTPAVIDFTKERSLGILRIDGDVLTICLDTAQSGRPPLDFQSLPGSTTTLVQLTRAKR